MDSFVKIAIAKDWMGWYSKFSSAIQKSIIDGEYIDYQIIEINSHDWIEKIQDFHVVLWNPNLMGIRLASHYKEKVYFLEKILKKIVFPNYNTIWHFESKIAQSYLFKEFGIKTPYTFSSFHYEDAYKKLLDEKLPIVLKKSEGSASRYVQLVSNRKWLFIFLEKTFCNQLWAQYRSGASKIKFIYKYFHKRWFWYSFLSRLGFHYGDGVVYWQDYIQNNDADLRITVIGDRYAYGFWRKNRPNDFRASGSGRIDYITPVPESMLIYCKEINKKFELDSMAYDLLISNETFVINEMSYSYLDRALYNSPGYYIYNKDKITYLSKHVWPQELWVELLIGRINSGKYNRYKII